MIMLSLHITVTRLRSTTTAPYQIHIFIPVVIGVVGRIVITAVVRKDYGASDTDCDCVCWDYNCARGSGCGETKGCV